MKAARVAVAPVKAAMVVGLNTLVIAPTIVQMIVARADPAAAEPTLVETGTSSPLAGITSPCVRRPLMDAEFPPSRVRRILGPLRYDIVVMQLERWTVLRKVTERIAYHL